MKCNGHDFKLQSNEKAENGESAVLHGENAYGMGRRPFFLILILILFVIVIVIVIVLFSGTDDDDDDDEEYDNE